MGVIWVKMEIFEPEATGRNSVARKRKELPQIGWCQNDRNFGGFAAVHSDFYVEGPKRAFLALFWAPGGLGPIRNRRIDGCDGTEISVALAVAIFRIDS